MDIKYQAKRLRRLVRRSRQRVLYWQFPLAESPIIFGNSFPKSGTHLLTQVLTGFARVAPVVDSGLPAILTFEGATGKVRPVDSILLDLNRLRGGDIAYGHLHAHPRIVSWFERHEIAHIFIYRDPRDIVVSHVYYVTEMDPTHVHHDYYAHGLKNFDERLMTSILGRNELVNPFPNIQERFAPYLGWLNDRNVHCVKYEDLIVRADDTLSGIVDYLLRKGLNTNKSKVKIVEAIKQNIDPQRSPTFRSGKIGGWREFFTSEHKRVFKKVAGEMLINLGYERDNNW